MPSSPPTQDYLDWVYRQSTKRLKATPQDFLEAFPHLELADAEDLLFRSTKASELSDDRKESFLSSAREMFRELALAGNLDHDSRLEIKKVVKAKEKKVKKLTEVGEDGVSLMDRKDSLRPQHGNENESMKGVQEFSFDLTEVSGPHKELPENVIIKRFDSMNDRWLYSGICLGHVSIVSAEALDFKLPKSTKHIINMFMATQSSDRRNRPSFPPGENNGFDMPLIRAFNSVISSHAADTTTENCCLRPNSERSFVFRHISPLLGEVFSSHEGFSVEYDLGLTDAPERPDITITYLANAVGLGVITPCQSQPLAMDADRCRIPELMKRVLHDRVKNGPLRARNELFGFFFVQDMVEISVLRLVPADEKFTAVSYEYMMYHPFPLGTLLEREGYITRLVKALFRIKGLMQESTPGIECTQPSVEVVKNMLSAFKPTLRPVQDVKSP